jgi:hypothetical protein
VRYQQPALLYRNEGGSRFEDVSDRVGPDLRRPRVGRGCAFGDLDNDGDIDVVINVLDGPPVVLRNDRRNQNGWLIVKCVGTKSNRSAIGARVSISAGGRTQIGEVMSGGSYYSHNDLRLHFGLASAKIVDTLTVTWPSGMVDRLEGVQTNRIITVKEGISPLRNNLGTDRER